MTVFVDAVAEAAGHLECRRSCRWSSMTMSRMTSPFVPRGRVERSGFGVGKVGGECDVDVAGAEGVRCLWWSRVGRRLVELVLGEAALAGFCCGGVGSGVSAFACWGGLWVGCGGLDGSSYRAGR